MKNNREQRDKRTIKEVIKLNKQIMKKGTFEALNANHELFTLLNKKNNVPKWWSNILADKELYVEVRKDNYLNVYYYGGCIIKITYNRVTKTLDATTHQKYMGDDDSIGTDKKGNNLFEYRVCTSELEEPNYLDKLKKNIKEKYLKDNAYTAIKLEKNKLTVASEKKVQGELILKNKQLFIDSEFAYAIPLNLLNPESKDKLIRIDLVSVENGILTFIELKLISDPRLRGVNTEGTGILHQMENYRKYIKYYQYELMNYYKTIAEIKHKIGLCKGLLTINDINTKPLIFLVNNYSFTSTAREKRINDIENTLKTGNINYQIVNYSEC